MSLSQLETEIVGCRRCPRLVSWRESASARAPRALRGQEYWARPVPGFGDPEARLYVLGLAPSANGGNRTGRSFTGNPTADWLIAALYRAGLVNQPFSRHREDGLRCDGVRVGSAVRCAPPQNRPSAQERDACAPFLRAEVAALSDLRVILALGRFAWDCALRTFATGPVVRFGHGAEQALSSGQTLVASYHPSPQNVNTGRLTEAMFDQVLARACVLAGQVATAEAPVQP